MGKIVSCRSVFELFLDVESLGFCVNQNDKKKIISELCHNTGTQSYQRRPVWTDSFVIIFTTILF